MGNNLPTLWIDSNEPIEIEQLLSTSCPMVRAPLNSNGKADYMWLDSMGNDRQWERKQVGEALGDLDGVEEQLNRELASDPDELTLVIEGFALPTHRGMQVMRRSKDGRMFVPSTEIPRPTARAQPGMALRYESLKWSLRHKVGIEVVETPHWEVTAHAISAAYHQSQKREWTTMRRYVRPHIPAMDTNPHVDNLIRLKGTGIGPVKAQQLIDRFQTFWVVMATEREEVEDVLGATVAGKFFEAIGRYDD